MIWAGLAGAAEGAGAGAPALPAPSLAVIGMGRLIRDLLPSPGFAIFERILGKTSKTVLDPTALDVGIHDF